MQNKTQKKIYHEDVLVILHCEANYHNLSEATTTLLYLTIVCVCVRNLGWTQRDDSLVSHAINGAIQLGVGWSSGSKMASFSCQPL